MISAMRSCSGYANDFDAGKRNPPVRRSLTSRSRRKMPGYSSGCFSFYALQPSFRSFVPEACAGSKRNTRMKSHEKADRETELAGHAQAVYLYAVRQQ